MLGCPQHFKIATLKEEKVKEKAKVDSDRLKSIGNAYFGEEQTQDTEWWSEEDSVWWSKGKEGKKDSSKSKNNLPESDSRTYHQQKGADGEHRSYKGRGKDQKRKRKESSYCQSGGLSASETPTGCFLISPCVFCGDRRQKVPQLAPISFLVSNAFQAGLIEKNMHFSDEKVALT